MLAPAQAPVSLRAYPLHRSARVLAPFTCARKRLCLHPLHLHVHLSASVLAQGRQAQMQGASTLADMARVGAGAVSFVPTPCACTCSLCDCTLHVLLSARVIAPCTRTCQPVCMHIAHGVVSMCDCTMHRHLSACVIASCPSSSVCCHDPEG